MRSFEEPGEPEEIALCVRCGEEKPRRELERCPWCFKDFCRSCRFAGGVVGYCSRACAEAMFYGGDAEEGAEEE